jgi:hypothetical protein
MCRTRDDLFLATNLEVECILCTLIVFLVVGWDHKAKNAVLCYLSMDGSPSYP